MLPSELGPQSALPGSGRYLFTRLQKMVGAAVVQEHDVITLSEREV